MIPIIDIGLKIIDKIIPDPAAAADAKIKLIEANQAGQFKELDAAAQVITTEAKSEHYLTSTWRPITMLTFVFIIANNYIFYPYLVLFYDNAPVLELPPDLWQLLKIGIGGYLGSRGVEKVANTVKDWKLKI